MNDQQNVQREIDRATELISRAAGIDDATAQDRVKGWIVAVLNAIPGIGGPLASLADDYIPSKKQERLVAFVQELSGRIAASQYELNTQVVHTEEFAFIFERVLHGVADNYQQEKLKCYQNILLNSLADIEIPQEEKELFLLLLDGLTVRHLRIISILRAGKTGNIDQVIQQSYPSYDDDSVEYVVDDLRSKGLVKAKGAVYDPEISSSQNQLTPMGIRLVSFITVKA